MFVLALLLCMPIFVTCEKCEQKFTNKILHFGGKEKQPITIIVEVAFD